jgi:5-methyltetrahydrofolate--homocysteine methyltransferase
VHDIGKNLVKTILSNNGYTVHDLGKQVPANTIIEKAVEYGADAIGLSALLVSTSKQMPLIVNELARRGLNFPVLIGGAAINRKFGRRILFLEESDAPYEPGVFYCKDAFEGLDVMDRLSDRARRETFVQTIRDEAYAELDKPQPVRRERQYERIVTVKPSPDLPKPPFWGAKTIRDMPLEVVLKYLHKPELYRLSWGARNTHGDEWARLEAEFEARLERMTRAALRDKTLRPQAVYGFFPVNSEGDDLIVYDPEPFQHVLGANGGANGDVERREIARFAFPRQPFGEHLCISDYFAPLDGGKTDTVALQVVTVGAAASEEFDRMQAAHEYSEAYFFHGLAVQAAEATANYVNRTVINAQLGIPGGRGKRYSWGYPACPDLTDHAIVLQLLPAAATELGLSLSAGYQWIPEQSTAAIVVHHPDAKYYSVGVDRVEQIEGA